MLSKVRHADLTGVAFIFLAHRLRQHTTGAVCPTLGILATTASPKTWILPGRAQRRALLTATLTLPGTISLRSRLLKVGSQEKNQDLVR